MTADSGAWRLLRLVLRAAFRPGQDGARPLLLALQGHRPNQPVVLVPVPSAAGAVRRRGLDSTLALARQAARRLSGRYPTTVAPTLVHARGVRDQAELDALARQANLAGAFTLRAPVPTAPTVVVDDLVTTGSSLTEAARVLRRAGVTLVGAATVAAAQRHRT